MDASSGVSSLALAPSVAVGVVGAGAMGAGIAQVACLAGHRVLLYDTRAGAAAAAAEGILAMIDKLLSRGKITEAQASSVRQGLSPATTLEDFQGCGLVIEAIVENLEAKRALFRSLEEVLAADALLATNTSSLSVTAIASSLLHPERLLGMHFFNPAPLMPLVEIISGAATAEAAAQSLYATARSWGKVPVLARSTPGFIVNRVARPFYAESLRALHEGAADCATIDAILRESGGFRMGPFELMDLIGHDVNYAVTSSVFHAFYGDGRFTPSLRQLELVEAGFLGRKTGRGFYRYGEDAPVAAPATCEKGLPPGNLRVYGTEGLAAALDERLSHANVPFAREGSHVDGRLAECDACVLYASDGRTATARSAESGIRDTVLVDLAFDPASAVRLAITKADQSGSAAIQAAAGLLQAAGYLVSVIDDTPGMIVLRTVAMLANEAAAAVGQGVCSAGDCDLAMRKGVNYPMGPLEWAGNLGPHAVVQVLDHLREAYGEERYRVSPLLRRKALTGGYFKEETTTGG